MAKISLPYGDEFLELRVPDRYIGTIVTPKCMPVASSPEDLILEAIHNPIGSPVLSRIVRPGQKVVLIVDDVSRETPANLILPHVLDQLLMAGTKPEDIRIVIALGTHRPMTQDEIIKKIGSDVAQSYLVINTRARMKAKQDTWGPHRSGFPHL